MDLDPVFLFRLQFVWVIARHIFMPAFTLGLASYIALLEGLYCATGQESYLRISSYWIRMFSVAFGVGVVSGVIMPFQFSTNWSR
jgi:cytochrome bd ubiquinol oxidase subunit I